MNNLHVTLAVLGAVVLAAVVAHGAWTSRKNQPKQAEAQPEQTTAVEPALDPVLDSERREPVLEGAMAAAEGFGALPLPRREAELDGLIDVIAPISIESVVSGEAALAALPPTRRVGTKPFAVEGLSAETGLWEPPVLSLIHI